MTLANARHVVSTESEPKLQKCSILDDAAVFAKARLGAVTKRKTATNGTYYTMLKYFDREY
jgi:hypothetical protein